MKLSIRDKLFVSLFIIVFLVISVSGLILSRSLKDNLIYKIELELSRHARIVRTLVMETSSMSSLEKADDICDRTGAAINARVTLIFSDGKLAGDSNLSQKQVAEIENHNDRPEIVDAFLLGQGRSIRYSTTVKREMIYVAERFKVDNTVGIVRISRPLSEVDKAVNALYSLLFIAGLLVLIFAVIMGAVTSHYFTRALRGLLKYAERAVSGKKGQAPIEGYGELSGLAYSVQKLVEKLERNVDDLAGERDRFEAVLEGMSEAVLALDKDRRITMINPAGIILLSLGDQPIGRTLLETIRVPDLNTLLNDLSPGKESNLEFDFSGVVPRRVLASASRRSIGEYVLVLQDVTELRRLEDLRRDFVSNVSHELRTPVSIISANAETLLDGAINDKEAAERFLNSMVKNADRLTNLVSDLLDISLIEEGRFEFEIKKISLALYLRRAAAALETKALKKGISIRVESIEKMNVMAEARALDQVLFNLLDNAVKYTSEGGKVIIRTKMADDYVRIEIEDNGPGIDPRHHSRLFERFFRVDTGRSRDMGGTGLGLAIVKHLITAMGGEVGMTPAISGGALFWIQLPGNNDSCSK